MFSAFYFASYVRSEHYFSIIYVNLQTISDKVTNCRFGAYHCAFPTDNRTDSQNWKFFLNAIHLTQLPLILPNKMLGIINRIEGQLDTMAVHLSL